MADVDDFLEHYGVKGMKWGRRSASPEVKVARKEARKTVRQEIDKNFQEGYEAKRSASGTKSGAFKTDLLYAVGPYNSAKLAQSAGYSRGKSVAIGMLGGPLGGAIAAEVKVRKTVNAAIN